MAYKKSEQYGGTDGGEFADNLTEVKRLSGVRIRAGDRIDAIQGIFETVGGGQKLGDHHGGKGGGENSFDIQSGDKIVRIEGRSDRRVDQLKFVTANGNTHGPYGKSSGNPFTILTPQGIGGFFGRSGGELDAIGVWLPDEGLKGKDDFLEIVFNNRNNIEITVGIEAPIGSPLDILHRIPAMTATTIRIGVPDVQSILFSVDDGTHSTTRQSFAMATPVEGRPCHLESMEVEYIIGSFTGTIKART